MKKLMFAAGVFALVVFGSGAALAQEMVQCENAIGASCGELGGTWHFVTPQVSSSETGTLTVVFTSGVCGPAEANPEDINRNNRHFFCDGFSGAITAASTSSRFNQ